MKGFEINFVQVRTYFLQEVFVKFTGKPITPKEFIINYGVNHLFNVSEGEKFLIEGMLLNSQAVWNNSNALHESFLLSNMLSVSSFSPSETLKRQSYPWLTIHPLGLMGFPVNFTNTSGSTKVLTCIEFISEPFMPKA